MNKILHSQRPSGAPRTGDLCGRIAEAAGASDITFIGRFVGAPHAALACGYFRPSLDRQPTVIPSEAAARVPSNPAPPRRQNKKVRHSERSGGQPLPGAALFTDVVKGESFARDRRTPIRPRGQQRSGVILSGVAAVLSFASRSSGRAATQSKNLPAVCCAETAFFGFQDAFLRHDRRTVRRFHDQQTLARFPSREQPSRRVRSQQKVAVILSRSGRPFLVPRSGTPGHGAKNLPAVSCAPACTTQGQP